MKTISEKKMENTIGGSVSGCVVDAFLGHGLASLSLWGAALISGPGVLLITGTVCYVKNNNK